MAEAEVRTIDLIGPAATEHRIETRRTRRVAGTYKDANGVLIPVYAEEETVTYKPPDWRPLMELASRRWGHWAPKARQEVRDPDRGPQEVSVDATVAGIMAKIDEIKAEFAPPSATEGEHLQLSDSAEVAPPSL